MSVKFDLRYSNHAQPAFAQFSGWGVNLIAPDTISGGYGAKDMKFTESRNDVVNEYISALGEDIAPLFLGIRACILTAGPALNESIKWKNCLVYGTTRNLIQTVVGKDKISLIFLDGASLEDHYGLLEGDGKKARTMRINSPEFNQEALRDYVVQTLNSDHSYRSKR